MRHPVESPHKKAAGVLVVVALLFIAMMTLKPVTASATLPVWCIVCGTLGGVDFALNLVLFVPLGMGLRWLFPGWKVPLAIGVLTTLIVETLQWQVIPGRDASLGDLLANSIGTLVGAWLAVEGVRWLTATPASARRMAGLFALVAAAVVAGSAWLLRPVSTRFPQWSQWKPPRRNLDLFQGRLFTVDLNGVPIHPTEVLLPDRSIDAESRSLTVRATVTGHLQPTRRQAIIVRIANPIEEGFALVQWKDALAFRSHMAAARLRLRPLLAGYDGAFGVPAVGAEGNGAELTILARSSPRAMMISISDSLRTDTVTLRRTVGFAWAMFLPRDVALTSHWWPVNAAWLGALWLPLGFFTMRSRRRTPDDSASSVAWMPMVLSVITLVAAPAVAGLSPLAIGEWTGVVLGLGTGWAIERLTHSQVAALSMH